MDEIDSIGSARMESGSGNGDSEVQRTMLELLNQLDGFEASNKIKVLLMIITLFASAVVVCLLALYLCIYMYYVWGYSSKSAKLLEEFMFRACDNMINLYRF